MRQPLIIASSSRAKIPKGPPCGELVYHLCDRTAGLWIGRRYLCRVRRDHRLRCHWCRCLMPCARTDRGALARAAPGQPTAASVQLDLRPPPSILPSYRPKRRCWLPHRGGSSRCRPECHSSPPRQQGRPRGAPPQIRSSTSRRVGECQRPRSTGLPSGH